MDCRFCCASSNADYSQFAANDVGWDSLCVFVAAVVRVFVLVASNPNLLTAAPPDRVAVMPAFSSVVLTITANSCNDVYSVIAALIAAYLLGEGAVAGDNTQTYIFSAQALAPVPKTDADFLPLDFVH